MKSFHIGQLLVANSLSEIAALGVTAQRSALQNLGLADANGALTFNAWGTNQNITFAPSGTGLLVGQFGTMKATLSETVASNVYLHILATATALSSSNFIIQGNGSDVIVNAPLATGSLRFSMGATEVARFAATTGRALYGTDTDSANGRVQIASDGTVATGIGFGTVTALYAPANGRLELQHIGGANPTLFLAEGSTQTLSLQTTSGVGYLSTTTAKSLVLRTNGTAALTLDASQNATFAGSVAAAGGSNFTFDGRSYISSPSDGVLVVRNNAGTGFDRFQIGGTSNLFPALKRSNAELQARLADDSAFTYLQAKLRGSNGTAGANFTGAIATLTVVDGVVTAAA